MVISLKNIYYVFYTYEFIKNQIKTFLKEAFNHPTNQPVQHEQRTMANLDSAFICLSFLKAT